MSNVSLLALANRVLARSTNKVSLPSCSLSLANPNVVEVHARVSNVSLLALANLFF